MFHPWNCNIYFISIYFCNELIFPFFANIAKIQYAETMSGIFCYEPPPKKSTQIKTWCTTTALEYAYCEIQISKPKLSANQFSELINSVASDVNMFQR